MKTKIMTLKLSKKEEEKILKAVEENGDCSKSSVVRKAINEVL